MARLTLTTETGSTHSIDLENLRYTIGRAGDCEIQIQDLSLSGHHARIEKQADGWNLTDLNSTNGSKINGVRLLGTQLLRHDDAIALGDVTGFFTDLSDVTRTREMPGAKRETPVAAASARDEDGAAPAPSSDAALAWRMVTLLAIADFALAIALAVALLLLWSSGSKDKEDAGAEPVAEQSN